MVPFGQVNPARSEVKPTMQQTKSKTRKLFKETILYYGQPVGARLNDLFDRWVQESCTVRSGKRDRDILVVSDGMPCKPARSGLATRRSHASSGRP